VATETSPPEIARKVQICPRKKRTEQAGAASQIQIDNPTGGGSAQKRRGREKTERARLQATMPTLGDCPASIDRFNKSAPIA